MKNRFTDGWKWAAILVMSLALAGLIGCGSSSGDGDGDGDGGSSGGGAYQGNYSGGFNGSDEGTMAFTVDGSGILAGTAFSTMDDMTYVISGDVNEVGFVSAGAYSSGVYSGTYEGTIDAGGAVRGTWGNLDGTGRGTFAAQQM